MSIRATTFRNLVIFVSLVFDLCAHANPCQGRGTIVFFVNGVFNDKKTADLNLKNFVRSTQPDLSEIKNLKYKLAWVEGMSKVKQTALAAVQRGVDDFQHFWLWIDGLEEAPTWFNDILKKTVFNSSFFSDTVLPRLNEHLELYSDGIIQGFQFIIVSHSVGNFYANSALRTLPNYVSSALQGSINKRRQENPYYPTSKEMIGNIQIASPAGATVDSSPWVTFKDDKVLNWIKFTGTLPGNVEANGVSSSDLRGHSFSSYLKVEESRQMIIQHMKFAVHQLKYPIPLHAPAATVRYQSVVNGQSTPSFSSDFYFNGRPITQTGEKSENSDNRFLQYYARCFDLRPGTVDIRAETISTRKEQSFHAFGFSGDAQDGAGLDLQMNSKHQIDHWQLGQVRVSSGKGKDPIEARVEFLKQPQLRK